MKFKTLFVPYDIAVLCKKKGFDKDCLAYYDADKKLKPIDTDFKNFREVSKSCIKAPTYQQIVDWFRIKHKLHIQVAYRTYVVKSCNGYYFTNQLGSAEQYWNGKFKTYYAAFEQAILSTLKIVK